MRLELPVATETSTSLFLLTVINPLDVRFESKMTMEQHQAYNKLLNDVVGYSANYPSGAKVSYSHQREVDYFYDEHLATGGTVHLRVTRDAITKELKPNGVLAKRRIADLNVYMPRYPFDYRISINSEAPMPVPSADKQPVFVREKDRLSYAHQRYNIDLTQVTVPHKVRWC